mgnify:CR=1 FL=1
MKSKNVSSSAEKSKRVDRLEKLGVDLKSWDYVVALAGNPNTGKSTVFNSLTGLRQHTGNWPGKTVTRAEGGFSFQEKRYKMVDLPGTYSLLSTSEDEEIARNFILFGEPDVTLIVIDSTRLERNLNLTLQILEITSKVVVCLNLIDEAERKGIVIDVEQLQSLLGVPVIPTSARYGDGLPKLLEAIKRIASDKTSQLESKVSLTMPGELKEAIDDIESDLKVMYPNLPNTRWIALRLLEGDERIETALKNDEFSNLTNIYHRKFEDLNSVLDEINKEVTHE